MKYKMEIISSMRNEVKYFDKLYMMVVDGGLLLRAKSKLFGDHFARMATKTPTGKPSTFMGQGLWKDQRFYAVPQPLPREVYGFIRPDYQESLFFDGAPALQWFLHVDLASGLELVIPVALSQNNFEDYFSSCCTAVQNFHNSVLRGGELEASFSYTREETE